ncbi:hypothetical protein FACS1894103_0240 [Campylobacterota bacterium]|nr:hypothetical protein FACS1894103_0240 [Campylobacterota bacterium]
MIVVQAMIALGIMFAIFKGMDMYVKYYDKHHPDQHNAAHPAS